MTIKMIVAALSFLLLTRCSLSACPGPPQLGKCYHSSNGKDPIDYQVTKLMLHGFMYKESDDPSWFEQRYAIYDIFPGDKEIDCYWKSNQ